MQTIDLYRNYLAQTAILNALDRTGLKVSASQFTICPGRGIGSGFTVERVESAVEATRVIDWLSGRKVIGFGHTDCSIKIFADGWNVRTPSESGKALQELRAELPGPTCILTDTDGERSAAGIIHGQTYVIVVGNVSAHKAAN